MGEIIKIERACKIGEINRNGYKYDKDAYTKAMDEYNKKLK